MAARAARPTLLDIRWSLGNSRGRSDYEDGHIPGAVYIDLDTQLSDPPGTRGRHPLPDPESFQAAMQAAGVCNSRPVVVYDAATSAAAARGWWLLRHYGHRDVAVLDGGLAAWVDAGYELSSDGPQVQLGDFVARPGVMPFLDTDQAATVAVRGILLDARAPERFRGDHDPIDPVAGHIPGARNVPSMLAVDPSGRFLPRAALRKLFRRVGVSEEEEIGVYCGSGVTAAHEVLALEVAGYPAALYPGSWSEWITDPRRPVAKGAAS